MSRGAGGDLRSDAGPPGPHGHTGRALAHLRRATGMTQTEIGEAAGLSREAVCHLERGRNEITLSNLRQLAHALGLRSWQLLQKLEALEAWNP